MKSGWLPLLVVCGVFALCFQAVRGPAHTVPPSAPPAPEVDDLAAAAVKVNAPFEARWKELELIPAEPADELLVLRRLTLGLMGTIPSLEEVRQFEADTEPRRLERWALKILDDRRFADYFAERLARCFVGADGGQFVVFRRDRFVSWLSEELQQNTPYDELVRRIVAGRGLWTGEPQSNFMTSAYANNDLDENKLAARSVRAFLGQSMDCAQCHDHPFATWKQGQFEGLAAQFAQVEIGPLGVHDGRREKFTVQDRKTLKDREVAAAVPFHSEWLPAEGPQRDRFAQWLTHPDNRRFERAIVNRVWGLMFGRSFIAPVDDMPNPPESGKEDVLDVLASDFRAHGCDLRRLIQVIAASRPFRMRSQYDSDDAALLGMLDEEWAVFPLTRLRPEQVIGSMLQASSVQTIDQNSHLFTRAQRFFRERDFVREYGDLGDQELVDHTGTIPQALLRMNSDMTREAVKSSPFGSSNRVAKMCPTDQSVVETAYLICVARRPEPEELEWFKRQLSGANAKEEKQRPPERETVVEDIFWTLFNSDEFSWNH